MCQYPNQMLHVQCSGWLANWLVAGGGWLTHFTMPKTSMPGNDDDDTDGGSIDIDEYSEMCSGGRLILVFDLHAFMCNV